MSTARSPVATVGFIDEAATYYRDIFSDIRQYECFKWPLVGSLSVLPRKSLPAIAQLMRLKDSQSLQHFLRDSVWSVALLYQRRLRRIQQQLGQRRITLCMDETGDVKQGHATDYAATQYIGNPGCRANGIVSVNAYAVVDETDIIERSIALITSAATTCFNP